MLLGAAGVYPFILYDYVHTSANIVILYAPDRSIEHNQMQEGGAYANVLYRMTHVFDDQWTFDGFRGPKTSAPSVATIPVKNLDYFAWLAGLINDRMLDILALGDPLVKEQTSMTFSRAVFDCVLSTSSQLPYMSKVFFFACLDKIANISSQLGYYGSESEAWSTYIGTDFLSNELDAFLADVPSPVGTYLQNVVRRIVDNLRTDGVTPEMLRDVRNSHHGYDLRGNAPARLFATSGELHNDISLLATPLVLYILHNKWPINRS